VFSLVHDHKHGRFFLGGIFGEFMFLLFRLWSVDSWLAWISMGMGHSKQGIHRANGGIVAKIWKMYLSSGIVLLLRGGTSRCAVSRPFVYHLVIDCPICLSFAL